MAARFSIIAILLPAPAGGELSGVRVVCRARRQRWLAQARGLSRRWHGHRAELMGTERSSPRRSSSRSFIALKNAGDRAIMSALSRMMPAEAAGLC